MMIPGEGPTVTVLVRVVEMDRPARVKDLKSDAAAFGIGSDRKHQCQHTMGGRYSATSRRARGDDMPRTLGKQREIDGPG